MSPPRAERLVAAALALREACAGLRFAAPVAHVYDPLGYAWTPHETYLRRYGNTRKRAVFVGMNPGPFGMMQTGVPFGEVAAVRAFLRIDEKVAQIGTHVHARPSTRSSKASSPPPYPGSQPARAIATRS